MALPYPTKVVLPFDIATAQDMNERHANDVALANGSGLDDEAVTTDKVDWATLTRTPLAVTANSGYTINADVWSALGGFIVGGYIQVAGNFTTSEINVGDITFPTTPPTVVFRGGVDASSTRVAVAFIQAGGNIVVQAPDSFSGSVWFSFMSFLR